MSEIERDGPFPMGPEGLYSRSNERLGRAHYSAVQDFAGIHVTATGIDPSLGWTHYFREGPTTVFPPDLAFISVPPDGMAGQVRTPFQVSHHVGASCTDPVRSINVYDAGGRNVVAVTPAFHARRDGSLLGPERIRITNDKDNGFPLIRAMGNDSIFPLGFTIPTPGRADRYVALRMAHPTASRAIVLAALGQNNSTGWINRLTPEPRSGPREEPVFRFEQVEPAGSVLWIMVDFVEAVSLIDQLDAIRSVRVNDATGSHPIPVHDL